MSLAKDDAEKQLKALANLHKGGQTSNRQRRQQCRDIHFRELAERRRVVRQNAVGKRCLAFLQGEDFFLDAAGGDQLVDEDVLGLADPVRAVGGLVFGRRVPLRVPDDLMW